MDKESFSSEGTSIAVLQLENEPDTLRENKPPLCFVWGAWNSLAKQETLQPGAHSKMKIGFWLTKVFFVVIEIIEQF